MSKSTVEVVSRHVRKTLDSILSEKATAIIKRVKDCEHTSQCVNQRKRRARNLLRFHGTKPVIFKPVISGSNMVGLSQNMMSSFLTWENFDVLSWFEDWLSKASDWGDVLSVRVTKILELSSFGR